MEQGKDFEMRLLSIKYPFGNAMANNLEDKCVSAWGVEGVGGWTLTVTLGFKSQVRD